MAKKYENQNGKTEMWYVIDADEDARITYGVRDNITKEELKAAIKDERLEKLLNVVPSHKGDVFFVEAGTIHAIGKGNLIAEIQQNSNVTYRLYDYGRIGKDGKPRDLHIEKGLMVSNCRKTIPHKIDVYPDGTRLLGNCDYFAVREINLLGEKTLYADEKSYHALIVTDGEAKLVFKSKLQRLKTGETVFIPANVGEYSLCGTATFLLTTNSEK